MLVLPILKFKSLNFLLFCVILSLDLISVQQARITNTPDLLTHIYLNSSYLDISKLILWAVTCSVLSCFSTVPSLSLLFMVLSAHMVSLSFLTPIKCLLHVLFSGRDSWLLSEIKFLCTCSFYNEKK